MSDPVIPNVPAAIPADQAQFLEALKGTLEMILGQGRGTSEERALRVADLEKLGMDPATFLRGTIANPSYTVDAAPSAKTPAAPSELLVTKGPFVHTVTWTNPTDPIVSHIEVWIAEETQIRDDLAGPMGIVTVTDELRGQPGVYKFSGFDVTHDFTYWIRSISYAGNHSVWCPNEAQGGYVVPGDDSLQTTIDGVISVLAGQLSADELFSDLSARIDLIDTADTGLVDLVSGIIDTLDNATTGIKAKVAGLQTEVEEAGSGLLDRVDVIKDDIENVSTGLKAKVSMLNSQVSTTGSGLLDRVATMENEIGDIQLFDVNTTYALDKTVKYNDGIYLCIQEITATPAPLPTDTAYWKKIGESASLAGNIAANADAISTMDIRVTNNEGAITSQATSLASLTTRVGNNEADIITEQTARSTEDSALAESISALTARVGNNEADIVTEQTARANADSAMASDTTLLQARVTTNEGVAQGNAVNLLDEDAGPEHEVIADPWAFDYVWQEPIADYGLKVGDAISFSVMIKADTSADATKARIAYYDTNKVYISDSGGNAVNVPTWTRSDIDNSVIPAGTVYFAVFGYNSNPTPANIRFWMKEAMLVKGPKAVPFSLPIEARAKVVADAAVLTEQTARATAEAAIASDITGLTTRMGTAEADIVTEQTARSTQDAALSTSITGLTTRMDGAEADIATEQTARSDGDTALTNSITALTTRVGDAEAGITSEQTARASADTAMASDITALTTRVGDAEADIVSEQTARSDGDTALTTSINALTARVGTTEADIASEQTARVNADSAMASDVSAVSARVTPFEKKVFDGSFENGKDYWSSSYDGEVVAAVTSTNITVVSQGEAGGKALQVVGSTGLYAKNAIPVDVNRTYRMRFRVKQKINASVQSKQLVYAGVATLDKDFRAITTGVGAHRYFCARYDLLTDNDWHDEFEGEITGVGDVSYDQFRPGTAYVRPMFLVNYQGGDGTVLVDSIEMWDVTTLNAKITEEQTARAATDNAQAEDILALESTVNDPQTGVSATASGLTALTTRVTTAEGTISSNSGEITSLKNTVNDPTTGVQASADAIDALETNVTIADGKITTNTSKITSLETTVNNPSTGVAATASGLTGLTTRVTDAEGDITANSGEITLLKSNVEDPTTGLQANADAIEGLETKVNDGETGLSATATKVSNLSARVTTNEAVAQGNAVNLLGEDAGPEHTSSDAWAHKYYASEPIENIGLVVGDVISFSAKIKVATTEDAARLRIVFIDSDDAVITSYNSSSITTTTWGYATLENKTIPAGTVKMSAYINDADNTVNVSHSSKEAMLVKGPKAMPFSMPIEARAKVVSEAGILAERTIRVTAEEAIADSVDQVSSTVDGHTTTIEGHTTSINGIVGKHAVKIDANGHVTGYELINDGTVGEMKFLVDKFKIAFPGETTLVPFMLGLVNGIATLGINGNQVIDGTLMANAIQTGQLTAAHLAANQVLVGHTLKSSNYVEGSQGYLLDAANNVAKFWNIEATFGSECSGYPYVNLGGAPTSLAEINGTEGVKLSGIAEGADATPQLPLDDGLWGYWSADEEGGETAIDASGNGHHCTFGDSVTRVTGICGKALSFAASKASKISIASVTGLPSTQVTVSCWVYIDAMVAFHNFAKHEWAPETPAGWLLYSSDAQLMWGLWTTTGQKVTTHTTDFSGAWHHIAGTYDGDILNLYLDGEQVSTKTIGAYALDTAGPLDIAGDAYTKRMDEMRVYSRALSDKEIKALFLNPGGLKANKPDALTPQNNLADLDSDADGYLTNLDNAAFFPGTVNFNPTGAVLRRDGRPAGWSPTYSNTDPATITYDPEYKALCLYSDTDANIGMAGVAFPVIPGATYKITLEYKCLQADVSSGCYMRMYEVNSELPDGKYVVGYTSDNHLDVTPADQWVSLDSENIPVTTTWTTREMTYIPSGTALYASFLVLNWTNLGNDKLLIKNCKIVNKAEVNTINAGDGLAALDTNADGFLSNLDNASYFPGTSNFNPFGSVLSKAALPTKVPAGWSVFGPYSDSGSLVYNDTEKAIELQLTNVVGGVVGVGVPVSDTGRYMIETQIKGETINGQYGTIVVFEQSVPPDPGKYFIHPDTFIRYACGAAYPTTVFDLVEGSEDWTTQYRWLVSWYYFPLPTSYTTITREYKPSPGTKYISVGFIRERCNDAMNNIDEKIFIRSMKVVNAATDDSDLRHTSDTTKIDGGKIYAGSTIKVGNLDNVSDYCEIDSGDIGFYKYLNGEHRPFKSLKQIAAGTADSGIIKQINGPNEEPIYFENKPTIITVPSDMPVYRQANKDQDQTIRTYPSNIEEFAPNRWQFEPTCSLCLDSNLISEQGTVYGSTSDTLYSAKSLTTTIQNLATPNIRRIVVHGSAMGSWTAFGNVGSGEDPVYAWSLSGTYGVLLKFKLFTYYAGTWNDHGWCGEFSTQGISRDVVLDSGVVTSDISDFYIEGYMSNYNYNQYTGLAMTASSDLKASCSFSADPIDLYLGDATVEIAGGRVGYYAIG